MPIRQAWSLLISTFAPTLNRHTAYTCNLRLRPFATRQISYFHPPRMSDSESDGFRIADDSGSDDFVAAPKAKKAAPVKKAVASSSKAPKVCALSNIERSELTRERPQPSRKLQRRSNHLDPRRMLPMSLSRNMTLTPTNRRRNQRQSRRLRSSTVMTRTSQLETGLQNRRVPVKCTRRYVRLLCQSTILQLTCSYRNLSMYSNDPIRTLVQLKLSHR